MPLTPPGLPTSLVVPPVDVGSVLRGAARRYADRVAFHHDGVEQTFNELLARASQIANGLTAQGIRAGDVVAVHLGNRLDYPSIYYGILMAGAVFGPTNPLLPPMELAFQLEDVGAAAVITSGPPAAVLASIRGRIPARLIITVDADRANADASELFDEAISLATLVADQSSTPPPPLKEATDRLAHIAYTGGTTGRSKGVLLTHRHIVTNILQSSTWATGSVPILDAAGDLTLDQIGSPLDWPVPLGTAVAVNLTPWFHAMGVIGYLSVPILTGTTAVIHERFDPATYLADVERFGATTMGGAPPIFVALLRHPDLATRDLSSVRSMSSGAAPLPIAVLEGLQRRFPEATITEGYGLTEVTMVACGNPSWRSGVRKAGTVGVPGYDTQIKLVDPAGHTVPTGERGEVCIRGPQVMLGYHRQPAATAEAIQDGWLRTGDIGVQDEDGYLSIVDRAKDMLLYKGYNVFPRELEELLHAQAGVSGAAVVGRPDDEAGELPVAFVVLTAGARVTAADLQKAVNAQVTPYKKLREVHLVESIPVSAAGKVLRRELRARLVPSI